MIMMRNIYVGDCYSRKVVTPLITTDQNAYKIVWDSKCTSGSFKITALKADGTSVFDFGELSGEGLATYIVKNNMYDEEGPLKLFLAIVDQSSITTCREINFTVKKGADEASFAQDNANPINSLAMQVADLINQWNAKITEIENYVDNQINLALDGEY